MRWSLCSLSSGTPAPVFLQASKTLAFGFRSPAQRLCFCDRWHITQGTLSDSRLHKQINFYYCFACLLSSYLIDSLITGLHCITVTLWGAMKGGCLEMIDFSLQCRFFSFIYFFFCKLDTFFSSCLCHICLCPSAPLWRPNVRELIRLSHRYLVMWPEWRVTYNNAVLMLHGYWQSCSRVWPGFPH